MLAAGHSGAGVHLAAVRAATSAVPAAALPNSVQLGVGLWQLQASAAGMATPMAGLQALTSARKSVLWFAVDTPAACALDVLCGAIATVSVTFSNGSCPAVRVLLLGLAVGSIARHSAVAMLWAMVRNVHCTE